MKRTLISLIFIAAAFTNLWAQQCIQFTLGSREALPAISRTVSIDRVDGNLVTAYANKEELQALEAMGIACTTLEPQQPKVLNMATTVEQMANWDRYPTYETYVAMMQQYATQYPSHCSLDTIGYSRDGRLILCAHITSGEVAEVYRPEFFYSSTMHGDEVTGFYLMLRLIDTLLNGYGHNDYITELMNSIEIYINPLSNPDGTYHGGNSTVGGSQRYNANYVDLNRNYPDPFGTEPFNSQQIENTAMIDYVSHHNFKMSANLHGGAEVLNYPWDSYETYQQQHPQHDWWIEVSKRFIDTVKQYSNSHFRDVTNSGYIAGGDWYVISNGRQDYFNYYHNCLEITMELSTTKTLGTDRLNEYWQFEGPALISFMNEVRTAPNLGTQAITMAESESLTAYPNPTLGMVNIAPSQGGFLLNIYGNKVATVATGATTIDLTALPAGTYLYVSQGRCTRIVKQ